MSVLAASGWQFRCIGWAWWPVLPLAAVGVWALVRLYRLELATLAPKVRQRLLLLRGSALVLLLLFFLEPTLARRASETVLPLVGVVVDQSGSMAVKDEMMAPGAKLAEAIGLKFLPASVRPLKTNAAAQATSDKAVVTGAAEGSPTAKALAALASQCRFERAVKLAQQTVVPLFKDKARLKVFGLDTGLAPLDLDHPPSLLPNRATDFESSLAALARNWAQEYVGGVVLLSDGRQTTGTDPAPVIRSLHARGALLAGILVGDPGSPPDAVVAEISGSSEVFLGELVPMTVRYRITGAPDLDWDLVVTHHGKELERRPVRGNGEWQYETFAFAATNAGVDLYQARLELARDQSAETLLLPTGPVILEMWHNINGDYVSDLTSSPAFKNPPTSKGTFNQLEYSGRGERYGARIRGFLLPPQSGNYIFYISSDDSSELWVSPSDNPAAKTKVAYVSGFVPRGVWNSQPSQKSPPIALKAKLPYYFEVLHKQGGGEDHLAVGWQLPDGSRERPIPGNRLASFDDQSLERLAQRRRQLAQTRTNTWKEASLANNTAEFSVVVNQDPIRVLLVDSTPRWESRYLAAMFERDRRISFTRRYHSVIVEDKNTPLLPRKQAEWDAYDMVCLGDLDANELPTDAQKCLANFVAQRGGFLVCLAGPRGLPRAFSLGPLANLLPVRPTLQSSRESEPVTVALTPEGADSPVMLVLNDAGYNQKLWPLLPPLQWIADSVVAKPGATVLLAAQNPARTPIVATHRYGAGRVLWLGTEETWRWRDRLGERVHQTFWLQVMRWGLAGRLRGSDPRLQVGLDRYLMTSGETAELKARVYTKNGEPAREPPQIKLEEIGSNGETVPDSARTLEMLPLTAARTSRPAAATGQAPDAPATPEAAEVAGLWQLSLSDLREGSWRVTVLPRQGELKGVTESRELIVRDQNALEGLDLSGDLPGLNRLAAAGGHLAGTMDQAEAICKDLAAKLKPRTQEHRQTIRLWNSYFALIAVVALLCVEWVLRKRHGLP
jgi:hypothetical protein